MKKIVLLAFFATAGFVSAKDPVSGMPADAKNDKSPDVLYQCIQYNMHIWCTGAVVVDTVCWGEGTGTATYQDARRCMISNSQVLTEISCGEGTGSGW